MVKVNINGVEVEGTPEAIKAILSGQKEEIISMPLEEETVITKPLGEFAKRKYYRQIKNTFKKRKTYHTVDEYLDRVLSHMKQHKKITRAGILRLGIPEGSSAVKVTNRLKQMPNIESINLGKNGGRTYYLKGYVPAYKQNREVKGRRKRYVKSAYHTFMSEKIKQYVKQEGMDYMAAQHRALKEYQAMKQGKTETTETIPMQFPVIQTVAVDYRGIIKGIFENAIKLKLPVKYDDVSYSLALQNADMWNNFVAECTTAFDDIAKYFGVPNRFKVQFMDGDRVMVYE